MRLLAMILLTGSLLGCSASPARLTDSTVPTDFTLEVRDATGDGALFIVEPDRWFRAATGAIPDGHFYPPATRLLTPEQMEAIWAAVEVSGVLDERSRNLSTAPGHLWVQVQANHERITSQLEVDSVDSRALLAELQALGWIKP